MKTKKLIASIILSLCASCGGQVTPKPEQVFETKESLLRQYTIHHEKTSDINEHLPVLRQLASESSSVLEIGVRSVVSTWAVLLGLSENQLNTRSYIGLDLESPPVDKINLAKSLAASNGISFKFLIENDMDTDLAVTGKVDMLFIDSLHTYCHLRYELNKFSNNVKKYIALHDTSDPWGTVDDTEYHGNFSEYNSEFDCSKKGLWMAVQDFLQENTNWELFKRYENNHGLTVLKRKNLSN